MVERYLETNIVPTDLRPPPTPTRLAMVLSKTTIPKGVLHKVGRGGEGRVGEENFNLLFAP
jgi:hypothetical protein